MIQRTMCRFNLHRWVPGQRRCEPCDSEARRRRRLGLPPVDLPRYCRAGLHDLRDPENNFPSGGRCRACVLASRQAERDAKAATIPPRRCARPDCPNEFQPVGEKKRYCSEACQSTMAARRATGTPLDRSRQSLTCQNCGTVFTPFYARGQHQRWCSRACANQAAGKRRQASGRKRAPVTPEQRLRNMDRGSARLAKKAIEKVGSGAEVDWTVTLGALIKRDGNTCWLVGHGCLYPDQPCVERDGKAYNHPLYPTIDHVLPIKHGGAHTWKNVRLAHKACNREKHDDVCLGCGGPITTLGDNLCAKCLAKNRQPKVRLAVCRHCGAAQVQGGFCDTCGAKGADVWAGTGLTREDAHALSRSLGFDPKHPGKPQPVTTEWVTWFDAA